MSHFGMTLLIIVSDRYVTMQFIPTHSFQTKTYKTKAKHVAKHMCKQTKTMNRTLTKNVVSAQ